MDDLGRCLPCPPLGAQKQGDRDDNDDNEEQEHFHQICRSYQQYATFHQTRQQGVNHRVHQMLNEEGQQQPQQQQQQHPTIESIMPPSLLPQTLENQQYQKQFCDGTIRNQFFLDNVLKYSGVMTSQEVLRQRREEQQSSLTEWAMEDQMSKIDSVLKSVARDWSREGREERSVVYDRLVGALTRHMPLTKGEPCCSGGTCCDENTEDNELRQSSPPRVAVPGSGLGRLAWEIYSKGYSVQGSDFSLPMLLASDFILNGCGVPKTISFTTDAEEEGGGSAAAFKQFAISPWISETKNTTSFQHRMRTVVVPDVDPTSLQHEDDVGAATAAVAPEFTMMAGEFLSLYSHFLPNHSKHAPPSDKKKFHAVVCSFFLDTAPSLPHYLLTIYHMLEEGGLLLHFGPLMYHWSGHGGLLPGDKQQDARTNDNNGGGHPPYVNAAHQRRNKHLDRRYLSSIDYTWEEFRYMVLQCGFEILEEEMYIPARYTGDEKSMMKVVYDCAFLVARKKKSMDG